MSNNASQMQEVILQEIHKYVEDNKEKLDESPFGRKLGRFLRGKFANVSGQHDQWKQDRAERKARRQSAGREREIRSYLQDFFQDIERAFGVVNKEIGETLAWAEKMTGTAPRELRVFQSQVSELVKRAESIVDTVERQVLSGGGGSPSPRGPRREKPMRKPEPTRSGDDPYSDLMSKLSSGGLTEADFAAAVNETLEEMGATEDQMREIFEEDFGGDFARADGQPGMPDRDGVRPSGLSNKGCGPKRLKEDG